MTNEVENKEGKKKVPLRDQENQETQTFSSTKTLLLGLYHNSKTPRKEGDNMRAYLYDKHGKRIGTLRGDHETIHRKAWKIARKKGQLICRVIRPTAKKTTPKPVLDYIRAKLRILEGMADMIDPEWRKPFLVQKMVNVLNSTIKEAEVYVESAIRR